MMKWYKVTGATGGQEMSDHARTAQHCQVVQRADLTVEPVCIFK